MAFILDRGAAAYHRFPPDNELLSGTAAADRCSLRHISMPRASFARARLLFAALLAVTALNHARLAVAGAGNVTRHAVFVGLNFALALLLVARPRWALLPAALLSLQQIRAVAVEASVGVLVFFPALLTLLVVERRRTGGTPERRPAAPPGS
jgi:hypothetical protein